MTVLTERKSITVDVHAAMDQGARKDEACKLIGLTVRTLQRWELNIDCGDKRPDAIRESPKALSQEEKDEILRVCNSDLYKDMTPNEIVPILAENGVYIASESTFYRILKENDLLCHRSDTKDPHRSSPRGPIRCGRGISPFYGHAFRACIFICIFSWTCGAEK
jgi:putative transposase